MRRWPCTTRVGLSKRDAKSLETPRRTGSQRKVRRGGRLMSTSTLHPPAHPHVSVTGPREWGFGGLAVAWYALSTFAPLGLPNFVVVLVLGCSSRSRSSRTPGTPTRRRRDRLEPRPGRWRRVRSSRSPSGWTCCSGGSRSSPGTSSSPRCAAVCVVLPRLAETREFPRPAVLGHRELIIAVTALVACRPRVPGGRGVPPMVAFAVLAAGRDGGATDPARRSARRAGSRHRGGRCRPATSGCSWRLLGAAGLTGTFFVWRIYPPDA